MKVDHQFELPGHCADCPVRDLTLYSAARITNSDEIYRLRRGTREVRARQNIYVEGCELRQVMTLYSGWAFYYRVLPGGTRQIFSFLLPGDTMSLGALVSDALPFSIDALTDCVLCLFDRQELSSYVESDIALVRNAWQQCQNHQITMQQHLMQVGRCPAYERVAFLVMEIADRLAKRNMLRHESFPFPLRHSHVADALGLTHVHVGRVFQELEQDKVLRRRGRSIEVLDWARAREVQARSGAAINVVNSRR